MSGIQRYDVIVIGGGPAGMMAAYHAAARGKKVVIVEKNEILGKKLLITGGGRCNITNATYDTRQLLGRYGEAEPFLHSPFSRFAVKDTFDFFESRGLELKVEAEQRAFPITNKAQSVWDVLVQGLKQLEVEVRSRAEVVDIETVLEGGVKKVSGIKLKDGTYLYAPSIVVATGGKSHPETGSTGDGFVWMNKFGHTVVKSAVSLVPLRIKDAWVRKLQGVTLPEVKIHITYDAGDGIWEKDKAVKGKILFTHFGVSGPTILNLSKKVSDYLEYADVKLMLDIRPDLDHGALNRLLQDVFLQEAKKKIKNVLNAIVGEGIPQSFILAILERAQISPDMFCHSVTREMRMVLIEAIKKMEMFVDGLLGEDKAIVSSGGVELSEIDWKTMESKVIQGLYIVGDMLNINRPSGGYSLQLCWTTGYVAGQNT
jgi:hypothetical protein